MLSNFNRQRSSIFVAKLQPSICYAKIYANKKGHTQTQHLVHTKPYSLFDVKGLVIVTI